MLIAPFREATVTAPQTEDPNNKQYLEFNQTSFLHPNRGDRKVTPTLFQLMSATHLVYVAIPMMMLMTIVSHMMPAAGAAAGGAAGTLQWLP